MRRLLGIALLLLLVAACGRKGALMAPEGLVPARVTDLQALQRGDALQLSWTLPGRQEGGGKLTDLAGFRIMRHEVLPPAQECTECPDAWKLLKNVDLEYLQGVERAGDRLFVIDGTAKLGTAYQYRITAVNRDGDAGLSSAPVSYRVQPPLPQPRLTVVPSPTAIRLVCDAGSLPQGKSPAGFTFYRSRKGERLPLIPLTGAMLATPSHDDSGLTRGETYLYAAGIVVDNNGQLQESPLSATVEAALAPPD
ncbi:MAG: fibronectin type III domain-containing protein [Geobacter sp.]|nr:fibronectin type III domain-containing protein [Geobacter sp.]